MDQLELDIAHIGPEDLVPQHILGEARGLVEPFLKGLDGALLIYQGNWVNDGPNSSVS